MQNGRERWADLDSIQREAESKGERKDRKRRREEERAELWSLVLFSAEAADELKERNTKNHF